MAETMIDRAHRIAAEYFDMFNNQALDRFAALLAPTFVSHLRVGDVEGIEAFREMMVGVYAAFPDMEWFLEEQIVTEDRVVYRYSFQGTHRGPFLGIPASHKFVRQEGAEVLHLRSDGLIEEIWNYTDLMGLAARLNAINPLALEI